MVNRNNIVRLGLVGLSFAIIVIYMIVDLKYDFHISFSKESGFYNDDFELEIWGGAEVIFTIR